MATIMCLPEEMIAIILGDEDISFDDITNFRSTCSQFQYVLTKCESFRKKKFAQRWPYAKKLYYKESEENDQDKKSLSFIDRGINCAKLIRIFASKIIYKHFYKNDLINNYTCFKRVFHLDEHLIEIISKPEYFINNSFFMDEIKCLLTQSERSADCDLTERYCNKKMFHYLRQCSARRKLIIFNEQPHGQQLLERIATIVAQWFQPEKDVFYSRVKASLDTIAQGVLNCLREKHPDHSIFSMSAENCSYWKNHNIDDNHWNETEGTQLMHTLEEYIFGTLNFRTNISRFTKLEYMCIDHVLENKYGEEIILLIIYHSVARRLGLRCEVIKLAYRCRICISWKPNYAIDSLENIICFNLSTKKNEFPDCLIKQQRPRKFSVLTAKKILLEMLKILANLDWHNNSLMIIPQEVSSLYIWNTNLKEVSLQIKNAVQSDTRPKKVKFAIGMIVTHNKNECDQPTDKPSAGVIIGWHQYIDRRNVQFSTNKISDPVLPLKICSNFSDTNQQPHYIILTEKNEMCYVNEDAITLTTPKLIENREIGRYFCKFEDTHYVPNEMLARLYPQDTAITAKTTTSENLDDRNVLIDSKARLTRRRKLSSDEFFLSRCIWRCTRQHRGWMKCRTSMINKAERNNLALYDRNLSRLYSSVSNVVEVYADGDARQNSFMYAAVI